MDNPQAKTSEYERGWLAGLIDGEGYFTFARREGKKYPKIDCHVPVIGVTNTHIPTVNVVTNIFEKEGLPYWVSWVQPENPRHSRKWTIHVNGLKRVKPFLIWLTPYLVIKKTQAELMLDFINLRISKPYNAPYEDKEFELVYRVQQLNAPKVASTTTRRTSLIR